MFNWEDSRPKKKVVRPKRKPEKEEKIINNLIFKFIEL